MEGISSFQGISLGVALVKNGSAVQLRVESLLPAEEISAGLGPRTGLGKEGTMCPGT